MVAAGAGYTLLPALAVPAAPDPSGLTVTRGFDVDGPGRTVALAWRASDPRGAGLSHLAAFFRAHAPAGTTACRADDAPGTMRGRRDSVADPV
jgi:LysR family hydrogen peroxide-inducible transcriptional activator